MIQIGFLQIPTDSPIDVVVWFFSTIGWIVPVFFFCWGLVLTYQNWIRAEYRKTRKYVMLAIDVPKNSEQTMRAVENFFNHLSGAHQPLKFHHRWWKGEVKDPFSFEIVSIGGNIQYIIRFVSWYRDLVEAAIYAQYPEAELTEIEDYTKRWNIRLPHEKYQLFGTELILTNKEMYPITTYEKFEDGLSDEIKDPLAALLEVMNRIGPDEELWVQYLITPADNDWPHEIHAHAEIDKIIGAHHEAKKDFLYYLTLIPRTILDVITPVGEGGGHDTFGNTPPNRMLYLTEGEKSDVKEIQNKTNKIGFHTKIRWIYICPKEKYNTFKALHMVYGAFKQFNTLTSNGFKNDPHHLTAAIVLFKKTRLKYRRNHMLHAYKTRGHYFSPGEYGFILNSEELASLWHFPTMGVKAPLIQKVESKKAEPPTTLPTVDDLGNRPRTAKTITQRKSGPPANLPA